LELLDAEEEYVIEKQINELETNDDFKMLQKILDELIKENGDLKKLNFNNSKQIIELNKQMGFSNSKRLKDKKNKEFQEVKERPRSSQKSIQDLKLIQQQLQKHR
ncbi:21031_t:CDS:2, partial [Racocetra persica]